MDMEEEEEMSVVVISGNESRHLTANQTNSSCNIFHDVCWLNQQKDVREAFQAQSLSLYIPVRCPK